MRVPWPAAKMIDASLVPFGIVEGRFQMQAHGSSVGDLPRAQAAARGRFGAQRRNLRGYLLCKADKGARKRTGNLSILRDRIPSPRAPLFARASADLSGAAASLRPRS